MGKQLFHHAEVFHSPGFNINVKTAVSYWFCSDLWLFHLQFFVITLYSVLRKIFQRSSFIYNQNCVLNCNQDAVLRYRIRFSSRKMPSQVTKSPRELRCEMYFSKSSRKLQALAHWSSFKTTFWIVIKTQFWDIVYGLAHARSKLLLIHLQSKLRFEL